MACRKFALSTPIDLAQQRKIMGKLIYLIKAFDQKLLRKRPNVVCHTQSRLFFFPAPPPKTQKKPGVIEDCWKRKNKHTTEKALIHIVQERTRSTQCVAPNFYLTKKRNLHFCVRFTHKSTSNKYNVGIPGILFCLRYAILCDKIRAGF